MNRPARIITATALLAIAYGCAPAPINRPIKVGDVNTGANSVEAVRRQFQGTWTLDHYYVYEGDRRRDSVGDRRSSRSGERAGLRVPGRQPVADDQRRQRQADGVVVVEEKPLMCVDRLAYYPDDSRG